MPLYSYAHHFFARGCELAGCDAPDSRCDLYLVEGERRAVRACCGVHAREVAAFHDGLADYLANAWPELGQEWTPDEDFGTETERR